MKHHDIARKKFYCTLHIVLITRAYWKIAIVITCSDYLLTRSPFFDLYTRIFLIIFYDGITYHCHKEAVAKMKIAIRRSGTMIANGNAAGLFISIKQPQICREPTTVTVLCSQHSEKKLLMTRSAVIFPIWSFSTSYALRPREFENILHYKIGHRANLLSLWLMITTRCERTKNNITVLRDKIQRKFINRLGCVTLNNCPHANNKSPLIHTCSF